MAAPHDSVIPPVPDAPLPLHLGHEPDLREYAAITVRLWRRLITMDLERTLPAELASNTRDFDLEGTDEGTVEAFANRLPAWLIASSSDFTSCPKASAGEFVHKLLAGLTDPSDTRRYG